MWPDQRQHPLCSLPGFTPSHPRVAELPDWFHLKRKDIKILSRNGCLASFWPRYGSARLRNTTKCDSEKLTTKLAKMAPALAIHTGSSRICAATTSAAVLAIKPAMPDTAKVR